MNLFKKQRTLEHDESVEWVASEEVIAEDRDEWVISQSIQCVDASGRVFPGVPRIVVRSKPLLPRYFSKIGPDGWTASGLLGVMTIGFTGNGWAGLGVFLFLLVAFSYRFKREAFATGERST